MNTIVQVTNYRYYYLLIRVFPHQRHLIVFHWRLSDNKSPQVSKTLLSILTVLNNVMVSTRPPISNSSCPFSNPIVTVANIPITICIIVSCMFHSLFVFFNSLARSRYLSFFSHSFSFNSVVSRDSKVHNFASSLLFVDYY